MNPRVLVADDSRVMRKIIVHCLSALGVTDITEAGDGDEAIGRFNEQPFDLVLTDWEMPKQSGLEVVRAVRSKSPDMPVMMITSQSQEARVREAFDAGATAYLAKPFTASDLRALLARHLAI